MNLPNVDGSIPMPFGRLDGEVTYAGSTTQEDIERLFGDLLPKDRLMNEEEFGAVIDRCVANEWVAWKAAWERWRSEEHC